MPDSEYKEDGFYYPEWLDRILSYGSACSYVNRKGHRNNKYDILNIVIKRLEKSRKPGKNINRSYVFVALRNAIIDIWRKESNSPISSEFAGEIDEAKPVTPVDHKEHLKAHQELLDSILKKITCLDMRSRVIIKLKLHESYKFTFKELGNIVGYSESTARQEYDRYIKIVREKVVELGLAG